MHSEKKLYVKEEFGFGLVNGAVHEDELPRAVPCPYVTSPPATGGQSAEPTQFEAFLWKSPL